MASRQKNIKSILYEIDKHARAGLANRARLNGAGDNETGFLLPLQETVECGSTPADRKLELFHSRWGESVDPVFGECAY